MDSNEYEDSEEEDRFCLFGKLGIKGSCLKDVQPNGRPKVVPKGFVGIEYFRKRKEVFLVFGLRNGDFLLGEGERHQIVERPVFKGAGCRFQVVSSLIYDFLVLVLFEAPDALCDATKLRGRGRQGGPKI